ncbi:hypothetical protein EXW62_18660 [Bacillus mycoides]|nr:hypothetical protein EXW62_18660 [Bacillus mycoides]
MGVGLPVNARLVQLIISGGGTKPPLIKVSLYILVYVNYRQVQVFKTPMCSLNKRYHMEFDSRIQA